MKQFKFMMIPLIFVCLWTALVLAGRMNFLRDPGTFWHTVVGERILTSGFADKDEYTFTRAGQTWIPHQWLGEITMAISHRVNGLHSVLACGAALLAGLFTMLLVRWLRTGLHPILCLMILGVTIASAATHFHLRPHLFTMVGITLTMITLVEIDNRRKPWWYAAWLVPLYLIWANTHGGMVGGLMMLTLAGAGWTLQRMLGFDSPITRMKIFFGLIAIAVACSLCAVVTPYGSRIAETWIDIMQAPRLPEIIAEHAPFDVTRAANLPTLLVVILYLLLLLSVPRKHWKLSWFLPLFWMVQSYGRVRHAPLFSLCACVVLADAWPHTRIAAWLQQSRPDFYLHEGQEVKATWPALLGVLVVFLAGMGWQASRTPSAAWAILDANYWPTELDETLHQIAPKPGEPNRIFNDYIDGGYLIYHRPEFKVFVDDRCELFGDDWLVEFVQAGIDDERTTKYIADAQAEYGQFDFALTRLDTAFDRFITTRPEEWRIVQTTTTARLSQRIKPSPTVPALR